jgi:hypothetical protein
LNENLPQELFWKLNNKREVLVVRINKMKRDEHIKKKIGV